MRIQSVMYSSYQVKTVDNAVLKIQQETELYTYKKDYNELCNLLELFMYDALPERVSELKLKKKEIDLKYLPIIKEHKRILNNTKKRLNYNVERA